MAPFAQLPSFMIVGTPRSGTTLVQRLAAELVDVGVPPETHFFRHFAEPVLLRRTFPLAGPALREELRRYLSSPPVQPLGVDAEAVHAAVGGRCPTAMDLFGAVLAQLTDAAIVGEKTPGHLMWWRPATAARPLLKLVGVIRDPRAVTASLLEREWMSSPVTAVERWLSDEWLLRAASRSLGGGRFLVLRYEDVVADPEATRLAMSRFLGTAVGDGGPAAASAPLYLPSEQWKEGVLEPITTDRVDAWQRQLTPAQIAVVDALCASPMGRYGYRPAAEGAGTAPRLSARQQVDRYRFRWQRRLRLVRIEKYLARRGRFAAGAAGASP